MDQEITTALTVLMGLIAGLILGLAVNVVIQSPKLYVIETPEKKHFCLED